MKWISRLEARFGRYAVPHVTLGLIIGQVMAFLAAMMNDEVLSRLWLVRERVLEEEVWRLVTPALLHFGMLHLVMNLYWLWQFGGQIEDRRGLGFFAALLLVLAVASNLGQAAESQAHILQRQFRH